MVRIANIYCCAPFSVQGPRVVQTEGTGAAKGRERLRGDGTELSWLMRTTYIANEMQERRQQKVAEKANGNDHDVLSTDRESQLAAVEVIFTAKKSICLLPVAGATLSITIMDINLLG